MNALIMSYFLRRQRDSVDTLRQVIWFAFLPRGKTSMRNRRFSFWHHPLQLLSMLLLLGGSAGACADTYDPATNVLTIPVVTVGNTAFTNVRITVGSVISVGGGTAANAFDTYDAATNLLTIPSVSIGATTYTNVVIAVGSLISVGGSAPVPASAPLLVLVDPLGDATVGQAYSANVVAGILPPSNYTYMIDTLANGALPGGMTIDLNGTLRGTPTVTGKTDVNGNQLPNTFTFGVCAVDTLSRVSINPCPRTSITVNPATFTLTTSIVGMGTVSANTAGPTYSRGTVVTLTATPNPGYTFAGWSGACSGAGTCTVTMNSNLTVTATFNAIPSGPLSVSMASVQMTAPVCFTAPCTISTTITVSSTTGWDVLVSSFPDAFTPRFSPTSAGPGTTTVTISYRSYGVSSPCSGPLLTNGGFMRFTNLLRTNSPYTTIEVPVTVTLSRYCP